MMKRSLTLESELMARIEGGSTDRPAPGQDPKAICQRFAESLEPI